MCGKWCQWFREHLVMARRYGRISTDDAAVWIVDPGAAVTPVLLARVASDGPVLATDQLRRLRGRYSALALATVRQRFPEMTRSLKRGEDRLEILSALPTSNLPNLLSALNARYIAPTDLKAVHADCASVDLCLSMGALEHYKPQDLSALLAEMARIVRPGGVLCHIVDHRDHLYHFDPSKDCFHHLRFSDEAWRCTEGNLLLYVNRLLRSDYLRMLEEAGFEVRHSGYGLHLEEAARVRRELLWGRYREASEEDLKAAVCHYVAVRR